MLGVEARFGSMPPSKKIAKLAAATASSQPTNAQLIASLSRASLESIIASRLHAGSISRAEIIALIAPPSKPVAVSRGIQREGTGAFDDLEDSLLLSIVAQLSLAQRLTAATSVCKSWRFLKDQQELWTAALLRDPQAGTPWLARKLYHDHLPIWGTKLAKFIEFIPAASVTSLSLHTGEGTRIDVKAVERTLKALPSLRSVHLLGKSIKSSVLQALAKHPAVPSLTSIELAEPIHGSSKDVKALLVLALKLEHLSIPAKFVDDGLLSELCLAWTTQRGGPPLLSSLIVDGQQQLLLPAMPSFAKWFPELTTLSLAMNGYRDSQEKWETMAAVPTFSAGVAFTRLRHLHLQDGCTYDGVITTDQVSCRLSAYP